jgi:integrase
VTIMPNLRLAPVGRARRDANRAADLAAKTEQMILARLPWLAGPVGAPTTAEDDIAATARALRDLAETADEARLVSEVLHLAIDGWNAAHPDDTLSAPPVVTAIKAEADDWTAERLARLRRWRPLGRALRTLLDAPQQPQPPLTRAGIALATAIRHGGVASLRPLGALLDWLADPLAALSRAPGLPVWIDLKVRSRSRRPPATVTGIDTTGPYALRRFFVDPDTLAALAGWFDSAPTDQDRAALVAAAGRPKAMAALIGAAFSPGGVGGPIVIPLRDLIDGALAEAELAPDGPDRAGASVARGRQPSYGATPESWAAALGAPAAGALPKGRLTMTGADAPVIDPDDAPATSGDRRAARASAALNGLMNSINPEVRPDLTTDDHREMARTLRDRLVTARDSPLHRWTSAARLLLDWYVVELDRIRARSVQRYHNAVALPLIGGAADLDLGAATSEDLEELFAEIVETDARSPRERRNLRTVLRRVHAFGMRAAAWRLQPVDPEIFASDGTGTRIRAMVLSAAQVATARALIRRHPDYPPDIRLAADAVLLLQWRTGMRIGEACKALLGNLEPVDDGMLFVVPTRYGWNKTPWARRRIPVFALLSASEAEDMRAWLARRRQMGSAGPLFGVERPGGDPAPFAPSALGRLIGDALKAATGLEEVSNHTLRRAALGNLFRAIHAALRPVPHPALDRQAVDTHFTGWTEAEAARAAAAVAPVAIRRDAWRALARLAGHGDPEVTFEVYVHGWDLVLFEQFARAVPRAAYDGLVARLGDRVHHLDVGQGGTGANDLPPVDEAPLAERPRRLLAALAALDAGERIEAAAGAAFLPLAVVRQAQAVADDLRQLRTKRGQCRLQPPHRLACLAPQPVRSDAEQAEAERMIDALWQQRETLGDKLPAWIAPVLLTATQTNTGVQFDTSAALLRWMAIGADLAPAERWRLDLDVPTRGDPDTSAWYAAADDVPVQPRPRKNAASVSARLRLTHPAMAKDGARLAETFPNYASGSVRHAAHALAVALGLLRDDLEAALVSSRA